MLRSVSLPDSGRVPLARGAAHAGPLGPRAWAAAGFALFGVPSHVLPRTGQVEVELVGPLDGRAYAVRRALEVAEHWQVVDAETGWLAASGALDAERWLRQNLDVPEELRLALLFNDILSFSLPVAVAQLLDDPGGRERHFARQLRTERYPAGLRALDGLSAQAMAARHECQLMAAEAAGRDGVFDQLRARADQARAGLLAAQDRAAATQRSLAVAAGRLDSHRATESRLVDVRGEVQNRRLALAALEAQHERQRDLVVVHERARRAMGEHEPDWKAYGECVAEIARLSGTLAAEEATRTELLTVASEVLALQREQALIEADLARVQEAARAAVDLAEPVHQQQQLEQALAATQDRALRLEQANKGLQATLADSKRLEMQLAEVERQIADLEPMQAQGERVRKLQQQIDGARDQLRDVNRQADQLHFLEVASRTLSGYLDDLRKGAAVTERLAVRPGAGPSTQRAEERTVSAHLREAIDHQIEVLERQLRDWQTQSRQLVNTPQQANQLRSQLHQLEQDLAAGYKQELRLGALPPLRQQAKQLRERLAALKTTEDAYVKEQQECLDAPVRAGQQRHDLGVLNDPRSQRLALTREAARKEAVEGELRQVSKRLDEQRDREAQLQQRMSDMAATRGTIAAAVRRRDEAHDGYCGYLAQQAIVELTAGAQVEVQRIQTEREGQQRLLEEAQAQESRLAAELAETAGAVAAVPSLEGRLAEAEASVVNWAELERQASDELAAAEANRARLVDLRRRLEVHDRAEGLLSQARSNIQQGERRIGQMVRSDMARVASGYLHVLLDESAVSLAWDWGEAPVLVRDGASHALAQLPQQVRSACALALRLAIAADSCRLGTVFVAGLEAVEASATLFERLGSLPDFDQFLVPSGW